MGAGCKILLLVSVLITAIIFQQVWEVIKPLPVPKIETEEYWGIGKKTAYQEDKSIKTFTISYPNKSLTELKGRLPQSSNLHEPLEGVAFEYGFNSKKLEQVIKYWRDNYLPRWNEREQFLNQFAQFTTQIQGLNVHYIHVKPSNSQKQTKKVLPLLLLHGWPGSVREFYEIIPKLTVNNEKSDYIFEVIAPSLPGYGWSQAAAKKGLGPAQIAVVLRNLMLRLGHEKFVIQGGDWGSIIGNYMTTIFPDNVIGYHSNMCFVNTALSTFKLIIAGMYPPLFVEKNYEGFFFPAGEKLAYAIEESGYMHIQATKPDTIGTVLSNNPVGLAAYILEKFSTWTNSEYRKLQDGGLEKKYTLDSLLDNVMIYYLTNSITTSQRLYAEMFSKNTFKLELDRVQTNVPTGCARFKHDLASSLDWQLRDKFTNLIHSTYYLNGGHFAAFELPNVLYEDFVVFANKL